MRIKLTNIGMLESADVKLDGLTVVAGENDTGKSTIAKFLHLMLTYMVKYREQRGAQIEGEYLPYVENIFNDSNMLNAENYHASLSDNTHSKFRIELTKTISRKHDSIPLSYSFVNFMAPIFIDTPNILNLAKYIKNTSLLSSQYGFRFFLEFQMTDLVLRLSQDFNNNERNDLCSKIENIIGGEVFYDAQKDDFAFRKNGLNGSMNMHSTANGIKMFGLLQILISNGSLRDNSVLILDEPEVHLHPAWQLKYAEIIVELANNNIYVLVNSHSPYMIEALKVYSDKYGIADKTNFYLAEKNSDGLMSTTKDVTHDLEPIFKKLADPYKILDSLER